MGRVRSLVVAASSTAVRTVAIEEEEWRGREGRLGRDLLLKFSLVWCPRSRQAGRRPFSVSRRHCQSTLRVNFVRTCQRVA